jgi:hypothetical protein
MPETEYGQCLLEHIKLISRKPEVPPAIKVTYDCAVCLETFPVYSSVQLSGCEHRFCKDCLRGHVESFLENGRFPIQCPVCLLDRDITDPGSEFKFSACFLSSFVSCLLIADVLHFSFRF